MRTVKGLNNAVDYCAPSAFACPTPGRVWASVTYNQGEVTDEIGRTTVYTYSGIGMTSIRLPGQTSPQIAFGFDNLGRINSVTGPTGLWSYSYSQFQNARTTTSDGPSGEQVVVNWDATVGRPQSVTERVDSGPGPGRFIQYEYDGERRLTAITSPEMNRIVYARDTRGNVTTVTQVAKETSPAPDIVTTATYPATCTPHTITTCNQPLSTTDPRGPVTDYTYDPGHGGVLTVTQPAPATGVARPQTRIAYAPRSAWY